jgi:hypothetical protein
MASKTWFCYNRQCHRPMGQIVDGELVLRNGDPAIGQMNTDGAFLNVQCTQCGRVNKWVPKDTAITHAFMNMHSVRALVRAVKLIFVATETEVVEEEYFDEG